MTITGVAPSSRLKWTLWTIVSLILVVLVFSFRSRVALLVRFQLASDLATAPQGVTPGMGVDKADLRALAEFSPQQVAGYLDSSRTEWRAIACLVLRNQLERWDEANWQGIAPLLAGVSLNDRDTALRRLADETMVQLPSISLDDGRQILALIKRQPAGALHTSLISTVAKRCKCVWPGYAIWSGWRRASQRHAACSNRFSATPITPSERTPNVNCRQ